MAMKLLYILSFIDIFAIGLLMPLIGVHQLSLGGSRFVMGFLGSIHAFLQLISGPVVGNLSDSKGRKPLLIITLIGSLVSNLLLAIYSLPILIFSRILFGITYQSQVLLKALITDNTPPKDQAAVFAKIGALSAASFIVAPILGGHVIEYENGFVYVSFILSGCSLLSTILTFFLPNIKQKKSDSKPKGFFEKFREVDWKTFWDIFALKMLVETAFALYFQTFGLVFMVIFKSSQKELGYVIAFFSIANIISNLLIGKIKGMFYKDDLSSKKLYLHCVLGLAATLAVKTFYPTFWIYVLFLAPLAYFKAMMDSTLMENLLERVDEKEKGTVLGANESMLQLAGLATPLISASLNVHYGLTATIGFGIIPLVIASGLVLIANPKIKPKKGGNKKSN